MDPGYTIVGIHALSTVRCNACYTPRHFFDCSCCTERILVCLDLDVKLRLLFLADELHVGHLKTSFCMTCSLRLIAVTTFNAKAPFSPSGITENLKGFYIVVFVMQSFELFMQSLLNICGKGDKKILTNSCGTQSTPFKNRAWQDSLRSFFSFLPDVNWPFSSVNWMRKLPRRPGSTSCLVAVYVRGLPVEIVGTIAIPLIAYWISVLIFSDATLYEMHYVDLLTSTIWRAQISTNAKSTFCSRLNADVHSPTW